VATYTFFLLPDGSARISVSVAADLNHPCLSTSVRDLLKEPNSPGSEEHVASRPIRPTNFARIPQPSDLTGWPAGGRHGYRVNTCRRARPRYQLRSSRSANLRLIQPRSFNLILRADEMNSLIPSGHGSLRPISHPRLARSIPFASRKVGLLEDFIPSEHGSPRPVCNQLRSPCSADSVQRIH